MYESYFIKICKEWFNDETCFVRNNIHIPLSRIGIRYQKLGLFFIEVDNHSFVIDKSDFNNIANLLNAKNSAV